MSVAGIAATYVLRYLLNISKNHALDIWTLLQLSKIGKYRGRAIADPAFNSGYCWLIIPYISIQTRQALQKKK